MTKNTDNGYILETVDKDCGCFRMIPSESMGREFPLLVFHPSKESSGQQRFRVCYYLHGVNRQPLTEEGIRALYGKEKRMQELADTFQVIIAAPLVGNTWYMDSPKIKSSNFATFIGEELPKYMDDVYQTVASRTGRILAGFSMGGYGAVSLLCRYPDTFCAALSHCGVMELNAGIRDHDWDDASHTLEILGSYWNHQQAYHLNSCPNLLNRIQARRDVGIVLQVGVEDGLLKTNRRFREKLSAVGIPHVYAELPYGHECRANAMFSLLTFLRDIDPLEA